MQKTLVEIFMASNRVSIRKWEKLCAKELDWCQFNAAEIERLANELYRKYCSGEFFQKRKICLNIPALEKECDKGKTIELLKKYE